MAHDVFICHTPKDQCAANHICDALEANDFKCWLAPRDIEAGGSWAESVERAIEECRVFVLVVSASALASEAVARERALADKKRKRIVHAYVEDLPSLDSTGGFGYDHVRLWPRPAECTPQLVDRVRLWIEGGRRAEELDALGKRRAEELDALQKSLGSLSYGRRGVGGSREPDPPMLHFPAPRKASEGAASEVSQPASGAATKAGSAPGEARMKAEAASRRRPEKVWAATAPGGGRVSRFFGRLFGPKTDNVDCSLFAPPSVPRGENFLVQVFAHCPAQAEAARALAKEFDAAAERRGYRSLEAEIAHGTKLTFHLVMPGLEVGDPVQHLVWQGRPHSVQFGAYVPKDQKPGNIIGTVRLSVEDVPAGHIKFNLTIKAKQKGGATQKAAPAGDSARAYRKAFISYAAQDRAEVLKRVQMLSKLRIEFFQDVLDLEPGTRWEMELYRHIDESDLFLLFWSGAAKQSEWVLKEVRYALARKRDDDTSPPEIIPVIIEGPPPAAPPPELAHLHFNDYLVYFMAPPNA